MDEINAKKYLTGSTNKVTPLFNGDVLLTDQQAADLAQVPVNTIRYWRQKGAVPFVKVGKHPRIWLSDLEKAFNKPSATSNVCVSPTPGKMPLIGDIGRGS